MSSTDHSRHFFGAAAFVVAAVVIAAVLSPYVPASKEQIAGVILGNVLAWPGIVLAYYYGSSQQSHKKDAVIANLSDRADGTLNLSAQQETGA